MSKTYAIKHHPAGLVWGKHPYPEHFSLTFVCSRGLRWDGGDYSTREAAEVAAGAA
jgi:hypothetical protein